MTGAAFGSNASPAGSPSGGATSSISSLRIKKLRICDFRAFAGPEPVEIALMGKNFLVFGENGAGKSSIFHALDELFSTSLPSSVARKERLKNLKNVFSSGSVDDVFVEVELDDNDPPARWSAQGHPVDIVSGKADRRIVNGAYKKASLDYRALLDTNYRQGSGPVNLFDVCVRVLLRDYPALHNGQELPLFDLWRRMEDLPRMNRMTGSKMANIHALTLSMNAALGEATAALTPKVNEILMDLGWSDVRLDALQLSGVKFNWDRSRQRRTYVGCDILPKLLFRGTELRSPQTFLNEARLSALALAIYFAGRQVCANTLQPATPRLMVLDDVLIGLDQSNRLPVLQVVEKYFPDWQVVLLTYDRVWYEMARFYLADRNNWETLEIFEEIEPSGGSRPTLRPLNVDPVRSNIETARKFHGAHELAAAAVHARVAFELSLKKLCDRKGIPVRFHSDIRSVTTDDLLTAIEAWLGDAARAAIKMLLDPSITRVKMWRRVVLNPFSHSAPVNLTAIEVGGAIQAVEALHQELKTHIPR